MRTGNVTTQLAEVLYPLKGEDKEEEEERERRKNCIQVGYGDKMETISNGRTHVQYPSTSTFQSRVFLF